MALTLVATVSGTTSNSYLAVVDGDTLAEARFGADAWTAASSADKAKALVQATRDLDAVRIRGYKVDTNQALEFPRDCQEEPTDEIPADVQWACMEQALWILSNQTTGGTTDRQRLQAEGVVSFSVGGLSEAYGARVSGLDGHLAPEARRYMKAWVERNGRLLGPRDNPGEGRNWWPFGFDGGNWR